jgi:hypothetical protein
MQRTNNHTDEPISSALGMAIPSEWRAEFDAAARRPLQQRMKYAFFHTHKPVLNDAPFRAYDTTAEYRQWSEENLPDWLRYDHVRIPTS